MKREKKLIVIAGSYYIGMPKDWIEQFGLEKGDTLEVEYSDAPLITVRPINVRVPAK